MSKKPRQFTAPKPEPVRVIAPVAAEVSAHEEFAVLGESDVSSVEPVTRPTFEDFLFAHRRGASFEACAIHPFAGCYVGAGVSVGKEPRTFPIAQLFALDRSYTESILDDARISVRIVE